MCDDEDTEFLNLAAVCDAIHDFKTLYPAVKRSEDIILSGVKCISKPDDLDEFIDNPEDKLLEKYIGYDSIQAVLNDVIRNGYKKSISVHNINYSVRLLNINRKGSIKINASKMLSQGITEDELINFLDNTKVTLLLDAAFINVLKLLDTIEKRRLKVYHVINREVVNDSAKSKGLSELDTISQLIDTGDEPITYNKDSKFNTKYNLTLNKLRGITTYFTIKNGDQLLYRSLNGTENTKQQCKKKFSQGGLYRKDVIFQVKRSGDWLQALSCLDTKREYNDGEGVAENIALITHDRVLLVYSLFLGINVFFTCKDGELLYFKSLSLKKDMNEENSSEGSNTENSDKEPTDYLPYLWEHRKEIDLYINDKLVTSDYQGALSRSVREGLPTKWRVKTEPHKFNDDSSIFLNSLSKDKQKILSDAGMIITNNLSKHIYGGVGEVTPDMYINKVSLTPDETKKFTRDEMRDLFIYGFIDFTTHSNFRKTQKGGNRTKILCENYILELKDTIEAFDSGENPDYEYYENVSLIVLACLYEYKDSKDVYEIIQSIVFDILPSIEKKIETNEPDVIQFFGEDKYVADCTSFAARNIALHSLGLRTGSIETLGNRETYGVKIPPRAIETFNKMKTTLPPAFEERQNTIMKALDDFHIISISSKQPNMSTRKRGRNNNKVNNNMYKYTKRLREPSAIPVMGGKRRTRKSRK